MALFSLLKASFLFLLLAFSTAVASPSCSTSVLFHGQLRNFSNCVALPTQGASLAWTLTPSSPAASVAELEVLFQGSVQSGGWAGWGINPNALAMTGTQAFLAFQASNGSTVLPYNVDSGAKANGIQSGPISLDVVSMAAEIQDSAVSSLVKIRVDPEQVKSANVVWNKGKTVTNFRPGVHGFTSEDTSSMAVIDFTAGADTASFSASSSSSSSSSVPVAAVRPPHYNLKIVHAFLNALGWGLLLPMGVLAARYLKPLVPGPTWFYVHVTAQVLGFVLGAAGWATGMALGAFSEGIVFRSHRCVGIAAFALCLLQLLCAFLLRPKPDHRLRWAWNYFHYTLGLSTIALAVSNIFLGFDILQPTRAWRVSFIGGLAGIVALAFVFEVALFCFRLRRPATAEIREEAGKPAAVAGDQGVAVIPVEMV